MTDEEILNRWLSNGNHTPLSGTYMVSRDNLLDLIAAARADQTERCKEVCAQLARRDFPWASENADAYHAQADGARRCLDAISALSGGDGTAKLSGAGFGDT